MGTETATTINIVSSTSGDEGTTTGNSIASSSNSTGKNDGPPSTVQLPTSAMAAPSPVSTKAKSGSSGIIVNNNNNNNNNPTRTPPAGKNGKPLTVTVNGNDRSKDLNEHDVVCEKGRGDHERWPGNKLYRHLINVNKETYNDLAPIERSNIIGKIIGSIQEKDGWFVHHSEATGNWAKLTEEKVRKKVSDDLRREVRRRREKRSHNSLFSAKLRAIKEMEEAEVAARDILERVDDPRQSDVLFGPGARRHPGNKVYWHHMKLNLDQYIISPYGARSVISRNIVQIIRGQHGRFLEQDPKTGLWYSISDKRALEKTSHALSNMKYKTRKRHPDDPPFPTAPASLYSMGPHHVPHGFFPAPLHQLHQMHPHHPLPPPHGHHLAYRAMGPYGEEIGAYDDEMMEQEKIIEGDSPNTIFAKKRTKKFRLLNRMDDVPGTVVTPSVEQTPLKGKDSSAAKAGSMAPSAIDATAVGIASDKEAGVGTNAPGISGGAVSTIVTSTTTTTPAKPQADQTATPGTAKGGGKIISPNSSESSIEFQEQRNPNAHHHHQRRILQQMPGSIHPTDAATSSATDIPPRISHFDYIKSYGTLPGPAPGAAPPGSNAAFKTLTYAAGMRADEYSPHHAASAAAHMRRYLAPGLHPHHPHQPHPMVTAAHPTASQAEAVARRWAAAAGVGPPEYY